MRSHRMRGYGAWTAGWREGERRSSGGGGGGGGCAIVAICFGAIVMFSCVKVAFETGNFYALLIGLAVVIGIIRGLTQNDVYL